MKERPILFSGEMVRAILDGRKTQTRRILNTQPASYEVAEGLRIDNGRLIYGKEYRRHFRKVQYGKPGDRLWVRETFQLRTIGSGVYARYQADGSDRLVFPPETWNGIPDDSAWRPSIHMPRWASRITLEVLNVRVERLWSISRGDAMAEGCPHQNMMAGTSPVVWFSELWESINGQASWSINPWVWVIEFKRWEVK